MGGTASKQKGSEKVDKKKLVNIVDYVARNFILTSNFKDMNNLAKVDYCNKIVLLTTKIIADKMSDQEIEIIHRRVEDGQEKEDIKKEKVIFFKKENIDKLDVKNENDKQLMCNSIAKFYVRIAHIFAAIVTTVNPIYVYKDVKGEKIKIPLLKLKSLPTELKGVTPTVETRNICDDRLNILLNKNNYNVSKDTEIIVKPNFCTMNLDKTTEKGKVLLQEPGIPQLEELYYNVYDMKTGKYDKMSDAIKDGAYKKDLENFYKTFTGKTKMPMNSEGKPIITSFRDIELKDYHNSRGCIRDEKSVLEPLYRREYVGKKEGLFEKYALHVKNMMQSTETNRNKLISIIDEIFTYNKDVDKKKSTDKTIVINPEITLEKLTDITDKARNIIVSLYLTCEADFAKGVKIFEAIVEKNELEMNKDYIDSLKKDVDTKIATKQEKVERDEKKIIKSEEVTKAKIAEAIIEPERKKALEEYDKIKQPIESEIEELQSIIQKGSRDGKDIGEEETDKINKRINELQQKLKIGKEHADDYGYARDQRIALEKKDELVFLTLEEKEDEKAKLLKKKEKEVKEKEEMDKMKEDIYKTLSEEKKEQLSSLSQENKDVEMEKLLEKALLQKKEEKISRGDRRIHSRLEKDYYIPNVDKPIPLVHEVLPYDDAGHNLERGVGRDYYARYYRNRRDMPEYALPGKYPYKVYLPESKQVPKVASEKEEYNAPSPLPTKINEKLEQYKGKEESASEKAMRQAKEKQKKRELQ